MCLSLSDVEEHGLKKKISNIVEEVTVVSEKQMGVKIKNLNSLSEKIVTSSRDQ